MVEKLCVLALSELPSSPVLRDGLLKVLLFLIDERSYKIVALTDVSAQLLDSFSLRVPYTDERLNIKSWIERTVFEEKNIRVILANLTSFEFSTTSSKSLATAEEDSLVHSFIRLSALYGLRTDDAVCLTQPEKYFGILYDEEKIFPTVEEGEENKLGDDELLKAIKKINSRALEYVATFDGVYAQSATDTSPDDIAQSKVLVVGSGGREHALSIKLAESIHVSAVYVGPGNGGTHNLQKVSNVPCNVNDVESIVATAKSLDVDLVCIGPEVPLVNGVVDKLHEHGIPCFGPNKRAAKLEGSKAFSKSFMQRNDIPTAEFGIFNSNQVDAAKEYAKTATFDIVVKASGLAAGKGVYLPDTLEEALESIDILLNQTNEADVKEIVIEERLYGEEVSVLAFCDGKHAILMPPAQDHKRIFDGDKGKNTGGMGAYAPAPVMSENARLQSEVIRTIVDKTLEAAEREGFPFSGILYTGILITSSGPKVLEYNCRFGDPETQALLPLLKSDLFMTLGSCIPKSHRPIQFKELLCSRIEWHENASSCTIVASAKGYPEAYEKGKEISGLDGIQSDRIHICQAGTVRGDKGEILTNGGRVLSVCSINDNLSLALDAAYEVLNKTVTFEGMHFRRDIGARALKPPIRLGVLGSTRGSSMQYVIDAIDKGWLRATINVVVSNLRAAGILERARKYNINAKAISGKGIPRPEFDAKVTATLHEHQVELVLAIGYMRILSDEFVKEWWGKTLNVHPSLLPEFAGGMDLQVHQAVLDAGKDYSGCTVHFITEEVDGGPIAVQKKCQVFSTDKAETLKARVQAMEGPAFVESIYKFGNGDLEGLCS